MPSTGDGKKRSQVPSACNNCRGAKLKCSGERPRCQRCSDKGLLDCEFDVKVEGVTYRQQQKEDLTKCNHELEMHKTVLTHIRTADFLISAASVARLRMGYPLEAEYERVRGLLPTPEVAEAIQNELLVGFLRQPNPGLPGNQTTWEMLEARNAEAQRVEDASSNWQQPPSAATDLAEPSGPDWQAGEYIGDNINPSLLEQRRDPLPTMGYPMPPQRHQFLSGPPSGDYLGEGFRMQSNSDRYAGLSDVESEGRRSQRQRRRPRDGGGT